MLSIQSIREQPDLVHAALSRRHMDTALDQILALDEERRKVLHQAEELRARRNKVSSAIARRRRGEPLTLAEDVLGLLGNEQELISEMRQVGDQIKELEAAVSGQDAQLNEMLLQLPNLPDASVPEGESEKDNFVVRSEGTPRAFEFTPLPHWDLGERLGIIDFDRGVKLSGSRFYVLKGPGARLQRALITWMLDVHIARGYTEVYVPALVKGEVMQGAGQLPKFFDNLYRDAEEDLYLIPTAEVPVTNLYRDEILAPGSLPIYHVAYTPCFRREKVSAGRDVRGIKRVHQFDKVEMYKFVEPDRSYQEMEGMLADAEALCRMLDIPHRVVQICAGDLGFSAAKTYDVELWAPGCGEWLEVSSISNCTDFQARRANLRYRPEPNALRPGPSTSSGRSSGQARPQFMHTLNGSGLALPRTMIAVLETYQQPDGSVAVPDALRPYMGGIEVIRT